MAATRRSSCRGRSSSSDLLRVLRPLLLRQLEVPVGNLAPALSERGTTAMLAAAKIVVTLLKLRIGVFITASALAGLAISRGEPPDPAAIAALAVAVLTASGAVGAFNHYYERDSDRRMRRTATRPFASGQLAAGPLWPLTFARSSLPRSARTAAAGTLPALYVFWAPSPTGSSTRSGSSRAPGQHRDRRLAGSFAVLAGAAAVDPQPQWASSILAPCCSCGRRRISWSLAAAGRRLCRGEASPCCRWSRPSATGRGRSHLHRHASPACRWCHCGSAWAGSTAFRRGRRRLVRVEEAGCCTTPSRRAAMATFLASLVQLLLLVGIFATALAR